MRVQSATRHHHHFVSDSAKFLTVGQVRDRYGVSDTWVPHIHDHNFPKPIKLGGPSSARRWRLGGIIAWEAERTRINEGVS